MDITMRGMDGIAAAKAILEYDAECQDHHAVQSG
jgi:CheY-like chemotaxis protein